MGSLLAIAALLLMVGTGLKIIYSLSDTHNFLNIIIINTIAGLYHSFGVIKVLWDIAPDLNTKDFLSLPNLLPLSELFLVLLGASMLGKARYLKAILADALRTIHLRELTGSLSPSPVTIRQMVNHIEVEAPLPAWYEGPVGQLMIATIAGLIVAYATHLFRWA